jgi:hypothetical protein
MAQPATPWAILLCRFRDDTTEPFSHQYYEALRLTVDGRST